jgi:hypothetical protein
MTDQTTVRSEDQTTKTTTQAEGMDARWLTLQRTVAAAMIVVVAIPQVVIVQEFIPPLAIVGVLFVVALAFTWLRPRAAAVGVGALAGLWLLLNLANVSQVIVDLVRPSATLFFMVTLAMLVLGVAGLVGLVGVVRRTSGRLAVRTLQAGGAVLLGGLLLSLLADLS